jgi:hypothetical protein
MATEGTVRMREGKQFVIHFQPALDDRLKVATVSEFQQRRDFGGRQRVAETTEQLGIYCSQTNSAHIYL